MSYLVRTTRLLILLHFFVALCGRVVAAAERSEIDELWARALDEKLTGQERQAAAIEWGRRFSEADVATRRRALGARGVRLHPLLLDPIRGALKDEDLDVRSSAAGLLLGHRDEPSLEAAVAVLGEALDDPATRKNALYHLKWAGEAIFPALPALVQLLRDSGEDAEAARVLEVFEEVGPAAAPAVPDLVEVLTTDADGAASRRAAIALAHIGEPAKAAVPQLTELLNSEDRDTAVEAHIAIRRIDERSVPEPSPIRRFIPSYIEKLKGADIDQALLAMATLCRIGPAAVEAIPAIVDFIHRIKDSPEMEKYGLGIASHMMMFGEAALPEYLKLIKHPDPGIACLAAMFIGNGRMEHKAAKPEMIELLAETTGDVKACVVQGLGSISRDDPSVVPILMRAAEDPDSRVRKAALSAINFQEKASDEIFAALERARDDPDPDVRKAAEWPLQNMEAKRNLGKYREADE